MSGIDCLINERTIRIKIANRFLLGKREVTQNLQSPDKHPIAPEKRLQSPEKHPIAPEKRLQTPKNHFKRQINRQKRHIIIEIEAIAGQKQLDFPRIATYTNKVATYTEK